MSTAEQALILAQQAEIQRLRCRLKNFELPHMICYSDANELHSLEIERIPFLSMLDPDDIYTVVVDENTTAYVRFQRTKVDPRESHIEQRIELHKRGENRFFLGIDTKLVNRTPYAGETMRQMIDDLGNAMTEFVVRDKRDFTNMMRVFKDFIERAQTVIDS